MYKNKTEKYIVLLVGLGIYWFIFKGNIEKTNFYPQPQPQPISSKFYIFIHTFANIVNGPITPFKLSEFDLQLQNTFMLND